MIQVPRDLPDRCSVRMKRTWVADLFDSGLFPGLWNLLGTRVRTTVVDSATATYAHEQCSRAAVPTQSTQNCDASCLRLLFSLNLESACMIALFQCGQSRQCSFMSTCWSRMICLGHHGADQVKTVVSVVLLCFSDMRWSLFRLLKWMRTRQTHGSSYHASHGCDTADVVFVAARWHFTSALCWSHLSQTKAPDHATPPASAYTYWMTVALHLY